MFDREGRDNPDEDIPLEQSAGSLDQLMTDNVMLLRAESAEKRKNEQHKHDLAKDRWITTAGFVLVFGLIVIDGVFSLLAHEKSYVTAFLHLLSSCIMLIMGYLFGTRKKEGE